MSSSGSSSSLILNSGGLGILGKLVVDGVSLIAAYGLNFIVCDLLYHNFNLQQSLKGSYWFFLGPILYMFGPSIAWVEAWIRSILLKEKNKLKEILEDAWHNIDPFDLAIVPREVFAQTVLSEKALKLQRENIEYLKEIGRIDNNN